MRSPQPARRERKSRDPGSGRPGARGRGGKVRHSVREGALERRGRSSGERGRRGWRARWARQAGRPRGRRPGPRLCSRRPPRPPAPPRGLRRAGAALTAGGGPGVGRAHVRVGGAGIRRRGLGCWGRDPGAVQASFVVAARAQDPLPAGARGPRPGRTPLPVGGEVPAPHPTRRAAPGPDCRPCGSAGRAIALKGSCRLRPRLSGVRA